MYSRKYKTVNKWDVEVEKGEREGLNMTDTTWKISKKLTGTRKS